MRPGEPMEFGFFLPEGMSGSVLTIYPNYLERADPGEAFSADGGMGWLDGLTSEVFELDFSGGRAEFDYVPENTGSYIAKWEAGGETFYRYFAAVDDDYVVLRFSTFFDTEVNPTLHAAGIPLDYRLDAEKFDPAEPVFVRLYGSYRKFGDGLIPVLPETPGMDSDERMRLYGGLMDKARGMLPDEVRSAWIGISESVEPEYSSVMMQLGVSDFCGLICGNGSPCLGMPEFPYFASPTDPRRPGESGMVSHQWDFSGGWHFLGPVSWHYGAGRGEWEPTAECIRKGVKEAANSAELSGHPAFLFPLYDGVVRYTGYPDPDFKEGCDGDGMRGYVERYQRFMALELTKEFKLVYARSVDIAGYYLKHFRSAPRTVFTSSTDHADYDKWWLPVWYFDRRVLAGGRLPWSTKMSDVFSARRSGEAHPTFKGLLKDPLSSEYVVFEDGRRSIRFERECPNPVWWTDYTVEWGELPYVETPDAAVERSDWMEDGNGVSIRLKMNSKEEFDGYAIALWGIPAPFTNDPSAIETNADECVPVRNTDGEFHLLLFFDLRPGLELSVFIRK